MTAEKVFPPNRGKKPDFLGREKTKWDPFFTPKPVGQGSGLGLSMVHRIINDHGGTIGVFDSALGGAGFEITLPLSETASA